MRQNAGIYSAHKTYSSAKAHCSFAEREGLWAGCADVKIKKKLSTYFLSYDLIVSPIEHKKRFPDGHSHSHLPEMEHVNYIFIINFEKEIYLWDPGKQVFWFLFITWMLKFVLIIREAIKKNKEYQ